MTNEESEKKVKKPTETFFFSGALVTLKILLIDLAFACFRLASEALQAYSLFKNEVHDTAAYGLVTVVIIMLPGLACALHLISHYRFKWIWYKTILYALGAIIFYPLVPVVALLHLLWMTPSDNKITEDYKNAQYGATVAQAIHGCIASPTMLSYQIFLAFRGVVVFTDTYRTTEIIIRDWEGNALNVTIAAPVCIFTAMIT